jgi:hypothetical protein
VQAKPYADDLQSPGAFIGRHPNYVLVQAREQRCFKRRCVTFEEDRVFVHRQMARELGEVPARGSIRFTSPVIFSSPYRRHRTNLPSGYTGVCIYSVTTSPVTESENSGSNAVRGALSPRAETEEIFLRWPLA